MAPFAVSWRLFVTVCCFCALSVTTHGQTAAPTAVPTGAPQPVHVRRSTAASNLPSVFDDQAWAPSQHQRSVEVMNAGAATSAPTTSPTAAPTSSPTAAPTAAPTASPQSFTAAPTALPTPAPIIPSCGVFNGSRWIDLTESQPLISKFAIPAIGIPERNFDVWDVSVCSERTMKHCGGYCWNSGICDNVVAFLGRYDSLSERCSTEYLNSRATPWTWEVDRAVATFTGINGGPTAVPRVRIEIVCAHSALLSPTNRPFDAHPGRQVDPILQFGWSQICPDPSHPNPPPSNDTPAPDLQPRTPSPVPPLTPRPVTPSPWSTLAPPPRRKPPRRPKGGSGDGESLKWVFVGLGLAAVVVIAVAVLVCLLWRQRTDKDKLPAVVVAEQAADAQTPGEVSSNVLQGPPHAHDDLTAVEMEPRDPDGFDDISKVALEAPAPPPPRPGALPPPAVATVQGDVDALQLGPPLTRETLPPQALPVEAAMVDPAVVQEGTVIGYTFHGTNSQMGKAHGDHSTASHSDPTVVEHQSPEVSEPDEPDDMAAVEVVDAGGALGGAAAGDLGAGDIDEDLGSDIRRGFGLKVIAEVGPTDDDDDDVMPVDVGGGAVSISAQIRSMGDELCEHDDCTADCHSDDVLDALEHPADRGTHDAADEHRDDGVAAVEEVDEDGAVGDRTPHSVTAGADAVENNASLCSHRNGSDGEDEEDAGAAPTDVPVSEEP